MRVRLNKQDIKRIENAGYGDDANTALAIADCRDGKRNLLSKVEVEAFIYTVPNETCDEDGEGCYEGPINNKVLIFDINY